MPHRGASLFWPRSVWAALAVHAIVLALLPFAGARTGLPLEDTLSHLEYAQLFDAFHSWSARNGRSYATAQETRSAITAYYYVRARAARALRDRRRVRGAVCRAHTGAKPPPPCARRAEQEGRHCVQCRLGAHRLHLRPE
jgi:hypothetical protein